MKKRKEILRKRYLLIITLLLIDVILLLTYFTRPITTFKTKFNTKSLSTDKIAYHFDNVSNLIKKYNNNDIIAEIKIPSLSIKEPVAITNDNDYYLDHDLNRNYTILGTPFMDFRTNRNLDHAKQINIYSHNSQYETYIPDLPFAKLETYKDQNNFNKNKTILLDTKTKEFEYKVIFTKVITQADPEHMTIDFSSDSAFITHVSLLRRNTIHDTLEEIDKDDKLIVLQTCHYNPKGSYLLVVAKRTK